jgi:hypothetical protein
MFDLGLWAGGDYRVTGGPVPDRDHPDDHRRKPKAGGSDSK